MFLQSSSGIDKNSFLHSQHYTNNCKTLLNIVEMIDNSIFLNITGDDLVQFLLFGNCEFS